MSEMITKLLELNGRLDTAEENISKHEDIVRKTTQHDAHRE